MIRQLLTISRNTFTESIRQPIFTVLTLIAALGLVLNPSLSAYSMETGDGDRKLLIDMGLSMVFLTGMLLAAFSATGVLSREIEQKTVLTVVSKPVNRALFVIGKYLGVVAAIFLAYWVLSLLFMGTYRHGVMSTARDDFDMPVIMLNLFAWLAALAVATVGNYLYNWVFTSTFIKTLAITSTLAFAGVLVVGKEWALQSPFTEFLDNRGQLLQIAIGLVFIFEAVLILTAVAIAVSTRLGQVMTLLICIATFLIGAITSSLSGKVNQRLSLPADMDVFQSLIAVATANTSAAQKIADIAQKLLYLVAPNLQFLWPADAITQGHSFIHDLEGNFTLSAVGMVSAYALMYTTVVLALAVILFQRREVG
ncbi:ABC transporter permease [Algisphaera agarilytica]|uniref:ABC-type transport system involved in multi-copper enzyme maturation permease subunit n=1 Tax=Algisphaera agarilytica TaxID=1385975 RepID=A0A7X0LKH2_9BACT|nr:ABC transporter permease [Algisphaera agarilytica]MBB6429854.1 ABC-type transport system involved in multi-copper enzyme maturation permease subunit [Algisphaera agarilytica]